MKTICGASSLEQAEFLIRTEVDEIYFGLQGIRSHRGDSSGIRSGAEMSRLLEMCAAARKKLYLAVNEIYPEKKYGEIAVIAEDFADSGGSGLIIRDPGVMGFLRKRGFKKAFILSSLGNCFNTEAMKFYSGLGVSRITLPQHMLPAEAVRLVKNNIGMATEVFCMFWGYCTNVDGSCRLQELPSASGLRHNCHNRFRTGKGYFRLPVLSRKECLDNLSRFYAMGVEYFKVARAPDFERAKKILFELIYFKKEVMARSIGRSAPK